MSSKISDLRGSLRPRIGHAIWTDDLPVLTWYFHVIGSDSDYWRTLPWNLFKLIKYSKEATMRRKLAGLPLMYLL